MIYHCCHENRKAAVLNHPALNGIDYLVVPDQSALPNGLPQRTLLVHCLNPLSGPVWTTDKVMIEGGKSITNITLDWVEPAFPGSPPSASHFSPMEQAYFASLPNATNVLVVRTHVAGDFSTYCLRLVNSAVRAAGATFKITETLDGFDPQLAEVSFSFKVECGPRFDCAPPVPNCPPVTATPPPINYLAKDYGSFRTLMLDRLNQLLPTWGGSSEADLGIALAELIAYMGDYLSYQQDAIATEAYLETARSRISLRRHAVLVDYHVHDGCNARAWIHLRVSGCGVFLNHTLTRFYTAAPGVPASLIGTADAETALLTGAQFFEPVEDACLYEEHNRIQFYTWKDTDCCLAKGATEATLVGSLTNLCPGNVLIFEEVVGPQTGDPADADIRHRCAVRLTAVTTQDGNGNLLQDTLDSSPPVSLTEIQWSAADALPFPLCLSSSYLDANGDIHNVSEVSAAFGNVVLADHGLTLGKVDGKNLGTVPQPRLTQPPNPAADRCDPQPLTPIPVRFRPTVPDSPLTQAVPLPAGFGPDVAAIASPPQSASPNGVSMVSATDVMNFDPSQAIPVISLVGTPLYGKPTTWAPLQDLLECGESDRYFVVEVDTDGTATLRFGDDVNGQRPDSGTAFTASYRIGNGTAGNVGPDSINQLNTTDSVFKSFFVSCRNPLPAIGGTDPETNDQIRRRAPQAFQIQERAVTPADYETVTEMNPQVDQASASLRWTGSWYTAFITVEPEGGGNLSQILETSLEKSVNAYRLAGQDLQFESPQYVSLEIALTVCVDPTYFNADVQQALLQVLSNQLLPNGQKGLFYPDNFTFGQTVYLSAVYVAARSVPGVLSVTATTFEPQGANPNQYLELGEIPMQSLQVARLDNDPSYPDHGQLTLTMMGGK